MSVTVEELEILVKANITDALKGMDVLRAKINDTLSKAVAPISNNAGNAIVKMATSSTVSMDKLKVSLSLVDRQIELQRKKLERLQAKYDTTFNTNIKFRLQDQIEATSISLDKLVEKSIGLSEKIQTGGMTNNVVKLNKEVEKIPPKMKETKESIEKTTESMEKAVNPIAKLAKRFKLLITAMIIRGIVRQVREGFDNLTKYSNAFNGTMSRLQSGLIQAQNSLAVAFAPLLQSLEPVLTRLIMAFSELMNTFAMYNTALFSNSKTYTRAKKVTTDYAKSLNGVANAQERALEGFDELNIMSEQTGFLGTGGIAYKDMFEEVAIPDNVLTTASNIKKTWEEIKPLVLAITGALIGAKVGTETAKLVDWAKKLLGADSATKSLTNSMLSKNKTLGDQTKKTQEETSMLWKLVPALAGAGAGAWALNWGFKKLNEDAKMPSIDAEPMTQGLRGATDSVYAYGDSVNATVPQTNNVFQTAFEGIKTGAENAVKGLQTMGDNVRTAYTNMSENTATWGVNVAENVKKTFVNIGINTKMAYETLMDNTAKFINTTSSNFVTWGTNLIENCGKTMSSWYASFTGALLSAWESFKDFAKATGDAIGKTFNANKEWIIPVGIALTGIAVAGAILASGGSVGLALPALALAKGGVLTQSTIVEAGEYAGAKSNPEIVTPQNIMYETNVKANIPVMNAIEEMTERLESALSQLRVYATFGYDKLRVGLETEDKKAGNKLFSY